MIGGGDGVSVIGGGVSVIGSGVSVSTGCSDALDELAPIHTYAFAGTRDTTTYTATRPSARRPSVVVRDAQGSRQRGGRTGRGDDVGGGSIVSVSVSVSVFDADGLANFQGGD